MEVFMIIFLITIIICIIAIWYVMTYNNFQNLIIKINESESFIDNTLRKRFDLLNKSIGIIKANTDIEEEVMGNIVKLRSRKLTNFDLDRQIYQAIIDFNNYREKYPSLKKNDSINKINNDLQESELEIIASRKYYNDVITDFNKLVQNFPSNIIAKFSNYKLRPYFDGKDMTDDIVNDFKL